MNASMREGFAELRSLDLPNGYEHRWCKKQRRGNRVIGKSTVQRYNCLWRCPQRDLRIDERGRSALANVDVYVEVLLTEPKSSDEMVHLESSSSTSKYLTAKNNNNFKTKN